MTKMVMKQQHSTFSLATPHMKAMFICQDDIANVVQSTSNFHIKKEGSLIHIHIVGLEENNAYIAT